MTKSRTAAPPANADLAPSSGSGAILQIIEETVLLFHRMKATSEAVHGRGELTAGLVGVMRGLLKTGPQTVPQMARARPVSRQHIQGLVNRLLDEGLVELHENPAHKRSRLVDLTQKGRETVQRMLFQEAELLFAYPFDVPEEDLVRTSRVLNRMRMAMGSPEFLALIEAQRNKAKSKDNQGGNAEK